MDLEVLVYKYFVCLRKMNKFQCDVCGVFSKSKNALCVHKSRQHGKKKFCCALCSVSFNRFVYAQKHSEKNHPNFIHKILEYGKDKFCPWCKFQFPQESQLKNIWKHL